MTNDERWLSIIVAVPAAIGLFLLLVSLIAEGVIRIRDALLGRRRCYIHGQLIISKRSGCIMWFCEGAANLPEFSKRGTTNEGWYWTSLDQTVYLKGPFQTYEEAIKEYQVANGIEEITAEDRLDWDENQRRLHSM